MMDEAREKHIAEIIANANEIEPQTVHDKPELIIDHDNPDVTVAAVARALAASGRVFDRGVPVEIAIDPSSKHKIVSPLTPASTIRLVHEVSRPRKQMAQGGHLKDTALSKHFAAMYLESRTVWGLSALNGFASCPLLSDDGRIRTANGYDRATGLFVEDLPDIEGIAPARPTRNDAQNALLKIRCIFRTFPFADAATTPEPDYTCRTVDLKTPPSVDESSALCAVLTAVVRPSLDLAPAVLISAPSYSGAGAGKGLLARTIAMIAYGRRPSAMTVGDTPQEFEKRLGAVLMAATPMVFIDNANNQALTSNLLASVLTETPAQVRLLGRSTMLPLHSKALFVVTGNGTTVKEDLARRFIAIDLDAKTEQPEQRTFPIDALEHAAEQRRELLAAALTIWRWGRQHQNLPKGIPVGSFDQWSRWCRDPLLALGCQDPIARQATLKDVDPEREHYSVICATWHGCHRDEFKTAEQLNRTVKELIVPGQHHRQRLASAVSRMAGLSINGFKVERRPKTGKWTVAQYRVVLTDFSDRSTNPSGA